MSVYEPSSPDSDSQCFSPGSCDDDTSSRKFLGVNKNKRLKASARERRRRHVLNDALESLRRKVSSVHSQNPHKLSKIEVLRLAIDYIAMLSYYLDATASPYYAQDNIASTVQQQQHIFAQYTGMVPHSSELVENFNKDAQMQPVQSTNRAEFDVYLRGYGNL